MTVFDRSVVTRLRGTLFRLFLIALGILSGLVDVVGRPYIISVSPQFKYSEGPLLFHVNPNCVPSIYSAVLTWRRLVTAQIQ